jgi:sensor histidine kinase YesM
MPVFSVLYLMSSRKVIWHVVFWVGYIALEYLGNIYHIRPGSEGTFVKSILLNLPFVLLPSYFMALVVVPRFILQKKVFVSILLILLTCIFVFYGRIFWLIEMSHFDWAMLTDPPMGKLWKNAIRDYSVIALATCVYLLADWRETQRQTEALIKAKAEAELRLLKGQLQPHFLFNTLNNIYSLSLTKSERTSDAILKLTELLDYLVYHAAKDRVPLRTELSLVNNYLDLEALRHEDRLGIIRDIQIKDDEIRITPLIILPFIENCFKHGGAGEDGLFHILYRIKASQNEMTLLVENSLPSREVQRKDSGGVGLVNVRQRLAHVYPDHELTTRLHNGKYSVYLRLAFNK